MPDQPPYPSGSSEGRAPQDFGELPQLVKSRIIEQILADLGGAGMPVGGGMRLMMRGYTKSDNDNYGKYEKE